MPILTGATEPLTNKPKPADSPKQGSRTSGASIEIRHLRYAAAAEIHGSFRKAALVLGVKQSTLSRTITQMEGRLGVKLFERSSGGVRVTKAGAGVLQSSRYLVDAVDLMTVKANSLNRGHAGQLSVGFYTPLSSGNLRTSLAEFAGKFPDVEIRTVEACRSRLFSSLEGGFLDLAIVTGVPGSDENAAMELWTERIMVALADTQQLAANKVIHWTDLKDETFLVSEQDPGPEIQNILISKLSPFGERPRIATHDASLETLKGLVGAGLGVGLVVEAGASYPGVTCREIQDGNGPSRISYAAHWRNDNFNPALANFIALLKERYPSPAGLD